ncbi:uncharacterized protein LOC128240700 [Mya arenaria]|nr:uncharacterized protein LOC128240700 [Mya arenaria]XP_052813401.1 uncharacterized protein LOC128240700 [Mya arenaria]XP_052813402.1 uncharacterized protein LOC128240700 [Mya arenaria]XP_052813403.1 uncharacterized protein LOC128240700 [Mya arenaria]XP_052813405.1 uncharacterized protein LOC128240700 [Mya arenaria]XP_052813406.1 uncharacterized protein LOC128240700 [Mya arenaria]
MEGKLKILKYGYPERPKWRQNNACPTVSEMLTDILSYLERFNILKDHAKGIRQKLVDLRSKIKTANRDLLLKYLVNVQQEEDIGVKDEGKTLEILKPLYKTICEFEIPFCDYDDLFFDNSDTESMEMNSDTESMEMNIETEEYSPPILGPFQSLEDDHTSNAEEEGLKKRVAETENLCKAFGEIASEINETKHQTTKQEFESDIGLFQREMLEGLHRLLMDGVMGEHTTLPGHYSTQRRITRHHGEGHEYPQFQTESIAEKTVQYLVDRYNSMRDEIQKANISEEERLKMLFKCASSFLFTFLQLHPFADGNGRLARLLASYSMLSFSRFMTPIYNVFSKSSEKDYIDALVKARQNLDPYPLITDQNTGFMLVNSLLQQEPSDLFAMLVESNWSMWRQFLIRLGDESVELFEWEKRPDYM